MAVRAIRLYPDRVLRVGTKAVEKLGPHHERVIKDLIDTLGAQRGGIGIAAPQIGYLDRIAVVDVSSRDPSKKRLILVNPEIKGRAGEQIGREGCMSLPDYTGNAKRASRITVKWRDENFIEQVMETDGIEAICIQHEVDHLSGLLFLDRVGSLARDIFRRKKYL